jgi:CRISPR-associated endonuclease/helicase Cas3
MVPRRKLAREGIFMAYAHSKNKLGRRQELVHHLLQVAEHSVRFADGIASRDLAFHVGILHDIGKWNPEFQTYLLEAEANSAIGRHGPDHKGRSSSHPVFGPGED